MDPISNWPITTKVYLLSRSNFKSIFCEVVKHNWTLLAMQCQLCGFQIQFELIKSLQRTQLHPFIHATHKFCSSNSFKIYSRQNKLPDLVRMVLFIGLGCNFKDISLGRLNWLFVQIGRCQVKYRFQGTFYTFYWPKSSKKCVCTLSTFHSQ